MIDPAPEDVRELVVVEVVHPARIVKTTEVGRGGVLKEVARELVDASGQRWPVLGHGLVLEASARSKHGLRYSIVQN